MHATVRDDAVGPATTCVAARLHADHESAGQRHPGKGITNTQTQESHENQT